MAVTLDSLLIDVSYVPASPSANRYNGRFAIIVTARNATGHRVIVALPKVGSGGGAVAFGYRIKGTGLFLSADDLSFDSGTSRFESGEQKQYAFDFSVDSAGGAASALPVGEFTVIGSFGGRDARVARPLTIAP